MEYPRCHLYFLRIHTVFKLIVHMFEEIHVQVIYVLFHVITIIIIIIIIVSLIQCAVCDWSILQAILYCTTHLIRKFPFLCS